MDKAALLLAFKIIGEYTNRRSHFLNHTISNGIQLTDSSLKKQLNTNVKFIKYASSLVENIKIIRQLSEIKNKETSCDFNILKMFQINEMKHSNLLAHLLNPNADHGQKHLFLNVFLDLLKIKRLNDNENWIVTAEKGRIDVLLKRTYPHSVIVLENKSNYANDQDHQLYRYWYQEIYKTICKKNLPQSYILDPPESFYQLIYLSPQFWKAPSANTLKKPIGWPSDLPEEIPLKAKHLVFSEFICQWLMNSLELLPKDNHRMRDYVRQYFEYWS